MKIETKVVTSFKITEVDGLDPITVTLEPESATAGRLTVTCYDRSWVTYFGSHGSDGLAKFVETVPTDYLVNRLATVEETEYVMDADALCQAAKKEVLSQRRSWVSNSR